MAASDSTGFNLDSLLDDLNQATKADSEPATIKFFPRRPSKDKSPNQVSNFKACDFGLF